MGQAVFSIAKSLLRETFLPPGAMILECRDRDHYIECVIYGPDVPAGAKEVVARKTQAIDLIPADHA